jgi:RNA polymerase sigma-70 factor (ECF subfamily)
MEGKPVDSMESRPFTIFSAASLGAQARPVTLQEQVTEIYESLRNDVYRYLLVLGLAPDQAQEVSQEAFLRLYAALRKGTRIENTRAWVFTVARNCAMSERASGAQLRSFDAEMEDQLVDESPSAERTLLDREKFRRLHHAVSSLSHQQRNCLHLRVEGFRYREIAEIVGVSTSTVGEFLRRAVNRLRKALYD